MKRVLVWVTPTGWEECIDAARAYDDVTLLQVSDVGPPDPGGQNNPDEFRARR